MQAANGGGATPFRITFKGYVEQGVATLQRNTDTNTGQFIAPVPLHDTPLAVVGGGPSLLDHVDELRAFKGQIWAVNATAQWLIERGIDCELVSVDAVVCPQLTGVSRAMFATCCDPQIVRQIPNVRLFHLAPYHPEGISGGSTTAVTMASVALKLGYYDVTYYGCEGSFVDADHVYYDEARPSQLIVRAAGQDYRTTPPFLVQCEELSKICRDFPSVYKEKSGGLLRAMIADEQWSVVAVSEALKQHLEEVNGKLGAFESRYQWGA